MEWVFVGLAISVALNYLLATELLKTRRKYKDYEEIIKEIKKLFPGMGRIIKKYPNFDKAERE